MTSEQHRGPEREARRLGPRASLALALLLLLAGFVARQQLDAMDAMFFRDVKGLAFYLVGAYGPAARAYRAQPGAAGSASAPHRAAALALERGDPRAALDAVAPILAVAPENANALALAAVAHGLLAETDQAIDRMNQMLRRNAFPGDDVSLHVLELAGVLADRPADARPYCLLAELYRYLRVLDPANGRLAVKAAREAIRRADRPADASLVLGVVAEKEGRMSEALAAYEQATRVDPRYAEAHRRQSMIHAARGDLGQQYRTIRTAFEIAPADRVYVAALDTAVLERLRDAPAAVLLMGQAVAADRTSPVPRRSLGRAYGLLGDYEASTAEYREAILLAPSEPASWHGLAWSLRQRGDVAGAIAAYEEVLRHDPKDPSAFEALGALYGRLDRPRDAIDAYTRALQLGSRDITTHEFLCVELFRAGEFGRAIPCLDAVLRRDPGNTTARTYRVWSERNAAARQRATP